MDFSPLWLLFVISTQKHLAKPGISEMCSVHMSVPATCVHVKYSALRFFSKESALMPAYSLENVTSVIKKI